MDCSLSPHAGFLPFPYREMWEMLLTWQRGNWKSRFAVWDLHTAGRALAENGGALWGGLWLRKKDFSLCMVCLFFCNICWHGKHLFPSMASQCLTQVQAFVYFLHGMASPIICCPLVILGAENGSTNPLTMLTFSSTLTSLEKLHWVWQLFLKMYI